MDTDLRIPITSDQKRFIVAAIADEPDGLASWARQILIREATKRLEGRNPSEGSVS